MEYDNGYSSVKTCLYAGVSNNVDRKLAQVFVQTFNLKKYIPKTRKIFVKNN